MANGRRIDAKVKYVNEVCRAFLEPISAVKNIECKHSGGGLGGGTFIKLSTVYGITNFYDVTDRTTEQIGYMLCHALSGIEVREKLNDTEAIREVDAVFG